MDDRPAWARRLVAERKARDWSQADTVRAMRLHATEELPEDQTLLRQWKRWESGETKPSDFCQPLIAKTFGTVTHAIFPIPGRRDGNSEISATTGMETLDILTRLQASDIDVATLDALHITADRLASEYPHMPSEQLLFEGRQWLSCVAGFQAQRLTLAQHREVLVIAGWLALLVACLENDTGDQKSAEATRRAALSLGQEAGHSEICGWAHEIRAWMSLTRGDYRGVISASKEGLNAARAQGVAVQLAAQAAKAWSRIGDRRQTELSLEEGRQLLERLPHPDNLDHHFVVDPVKFDFYAMDCYRQPAIGENQIAATLAN